MPRYQVTEPGFYAGKLYSPDGKRRVLSVDKPFNAKNKPSWVGEEIKELTAAQKKAAAKKTSEDAEKAEQDKIDVDAVTFAEDPAPAQPAVTTL